MFWSSTCRSTEALLMSFLVMQLFWRTFMALSIVTGDGSDMPSRQSPTGSPLVSTLANRTAIKSHLGDLLPTFKFVCGGELDSNTVETNCLKDALAKNPVGTDESICKVNFDTLKCIADTICKHCPFDKSEPAIDMLTIYLSDLTIGPTSTDTALCAKWKVDAPRLNCPDWPSLEEERKCKDTVSDDLKMCQDKFGEKYPDVEDGATSVPIEHYCKWLFECNGCYADAYCRACDRKVAQFLLKIINVSTYAPSKEDCSEWSYLKPRTECPISVLLIVAIVVGVVILLLIIVSVIVVVCMCRKSSHGHSHRHSSKKSSKSRRSSIRSSGRKHSSRISSRVAHSKARPSSRAGSRY